jgi:hypothetical protein
VSWDPDGGRSGRIDKTDSTAQKRKRRQEKRIPGRVRVFIASVACGLRRSTTVYGRGSDVQP